MRKDMFKVIVERPRGGARFRVNRSRLTSDEALPKRVGMKRFRSINRTDTKWLNENLAPLKRYLMKQVGRPWNKVYSEICENLDANNTVKQHVRDHLQDFIVTKVAIGRDGEWLNGNAYPSWRAAHKTWHQPLYVDPNDGADQTQRQAVEEARDCNAKALALITATFPSSRTHCSATRCYADPGSTNRRE